MKKKIIFILGVIFIGCIALSNAEASEYPPLYKAIIKGDIKKIDKLIEAGSNLEEVYNGYTPIEFATKSDYFNLEIVKLLVQKGAKQIQPNGSYSLWQIMTNSTTSDDEKIKSLKYILEGNEINPVLLIFIRDYGRIDYFVKQLGLDILKEQEGQILPLLHRASRASNLNLAKYLIEAGYNVNTLDQNGNNSIVYGIISRDLDLNWLNPVTETESTVELNIKTHYSSSSLEENSQLIKYLVSKGCRINNQNKMSWSALHFASTYQTQTTVSLLLEQGADKKLMTKFGRKPYDIAKVAGNTYVLDMLK